MAKGIDYGMGKANIDTATGIRYGVISFHTPSPEATQDIYTNGDNLSYQAAVEDAKERIALALTPVLDDLGVLPYSYSDKSGKRKGDAINGIVETVWADVEDAFNDRYEEDNDRYRYEHDGYVLETTSLGIYVVKSEYFTHATFCSPCCPGAGDLDSPDEDGIKTYALGHDWFEDGKAPYRVYRVSDGIEVLPEDV